MKQNFEDFQSQNNFLLIFYVIQHKYQRDSFIVMTIGIYEKLASEKVTDTTWNIGPDFSAFLQRIFFG